MDSYEKQELDKVKKKKELLNRLKSFLHKNGFDLKKLKFRFNYWRNEFRVCENKKGHNLGVYFSGDDNISNWEFKLKSIEYLK